MPAKPRSRRPSHATVVAYLALFVALGGTTYAATGGNFILGQSNSANATTSLASSSTGPALKVTSTSAGFATALGLNVPSGHAPFTVNSGTKVTNLNADKLDGKDASVLLDTCVSPLTARYGRICVGSDGMARDWHGAVDYCAGFGLRLPTLGEAMTLGRGFDVPGVEDDGSSFWTDNLYFDAGVYQVTAVFENGNEVSNPRSGAAQTVCVTDPSGGGN